MAASFRNNSSSRSVDGFTALSPWNTGTDQTASYSDAQSQLFSRVNTFDSHTGSASGRHQRFVLADPVAFRYLEEDKSVTVLERKRELHGYQCYIVEQWACSRTHPTFIIAAYTGNEAHVVTVGVLSVPADESQWSPRLQVYFQALTQYYARRKDTTLGSLMVTNLSGFPSSLTIIPVPDGDPHKHREDFFVNEDLKRLGCSGRVGMTLSEPSNATQAKFYQLYRVSEKIPFYSSVIELVKLCQAALMLFGCLEAEYVDGLLCDYTEKAINDWWVKVGLEMYNIEPTDGILGPTTVAALLGTLIGARNRLSAYGAPIGKDVFELETTKRAIAYFQKAQRLPRTRRLDRQTIERLQKATAKQASGEGWNVPRAVKSTVAELSGKSGEMVMDMVGKGERATIADVESTDIERVVANVKGERAKWLWYGKARKRTTRDLLGGTMTDEDEHQRSEQDNVDHQGSGIMSEAPRLLKRMTKPHSSENSADTDAFVKQTVFRRATGRIKGAVSRKNHHYKASKDSDTFYENDHNKSVETLGSASSDSPPSPRMYPKKNNGLEPVPALSRQATETELRRFPSFAGHLTDTPVDGRNGLRDSPMRDNYNTPSDPSGPDGPEDFVNMLTQQASASRSYLPDMELPVRPDDRPAQDIALMLQRTQSFSRLDGLHPSRPKQRNDAAWPRHLSFSTAESVVLWWTPIFSAPVSAEAQISPKHSLALERLRAMDSRRLREQIAKLGRDTADWMTRKLQDIEDLSTMASQDTEQLHGLYYPRRDEYNSLEEGSKEIIAQERNQLEESAKDLDTLDAKLEYEIESLRSKVEDVDRAVAEFETQVAYTEARVRELTAKSHGQSWWPWLQSILRARETPAMPKKLGNG